MRLSQIALSVIDLRRAHRWYREVVGLRPAGGTNLFAGPLASRVQGLPRAASTCWWLVDRQEQFQLELFEFRSPLVRRLPGDWRPSDVGYSMVSLAVEDLEATLERARAAGSPPLTDPIGEPGSRRACVRDADGVLVELMEDDPRDPRPRERPRPGISAVTRSVTLSVLDLDRSRRLFGETLDLVPAEGLELHRPEHEALWGLEGAQRESAVYWAEDLVVELVQYADPAPRPWPSGYRISDQGLLNIAFGFRERAAFEAASRRCLEAGCRPNAAPLRLGPWSVVYVNDEQGFSIELLRVEPWYERMMGFQPRPAPRIAPLAGRTLRPLPERRRFGKALVTGAAGGIGSELCRVLAEDGTELILCDRDRDGLMALDQQLAEKVTVRAHDVDFTDLEAVDELAAAIVHDHPDLDLVIANAGVDRAQSLLSFDWRQARDDFTVNALANLPLLGHVLPVMAKRGQGHVTAIVSLAGLLGMPYEAPYSASKAALATTIESARGELGPRGLTFTSVFPGFVDTPMFRANAFKHTYSIPAREAAERIYLASLRRRPTLAFPARERAKIAVARILPPLIRDRLVRDLMDLPPP